MRKIILNLAVTLDGFIEGPNGEIDWISRESTAEMGAGSPFDQFLSAIDAIFYGRVSYDLWGQYQPAKAALEQEKKLWENVHSKTKYVFSHHPKEDGKATFISGDVVTRVNEIKSQPGKNIWLYGGSGIITSFINLDLVDSFLLAVYPVVLGEGKPLFSNIKKRVELSLNKSIPSRSGVLLLDYDVKEKEIY